MTNFNGLRPREYRDLIRTATDQGWNVTFTGQGHVRLDPPPGSKDQRPVFGGSTVSDHRGYMNLRAILRHRGVIF